jgi:hypothetical protein
MVIMEHPNGCVHNVRDDLVNKFLNAGWNIKEGATAPSVVPAEPKKRKTTKSKKQ